MSSTASPSSSAGSGSGELITLSVGATANSLTALYFNRQVSPSHIAAVVAVQRCSGAVTDPTLLSLHHSGRS